MKFLYAVCLFLLSSVGLYAEENPMTFKYGYDGGNYFGAEWIAAEGKIVASTPDDFEKFYTDFFTEHGYYPGDRQIFLHSSGGDREAALRLGEKIRQLKFTTRIGRTVPNKQDYAEGTDWSVTEDGQCLSSCLWTFLGGADRDVEANQLGIHLGMIPVQLDRTSLRSMIKLGIEPALIEAFMQFEGDKVHYFNDDELDQYNIRMKQAEFTPWQIEPYKKGVVAYSKSRDETITATLSCNASQKITLQIKRPILYDFIDSKRIKDIHEATDSLEIFGVTFPKGAFQLELQDKDEILKINIKNWKDLSFNAEQLGVNPYTPRVFYMDFTNFAPFGFNNEGLERNAEIALKNCI